MPRRYVVAFDTAEEMGKPHELDAAIKRAMDLAKKDGVTATDHAKLKRRGAERWSFTDLRPKELRDKLEERVPKGDLGDTFVIGTPNPDRQVRIRVVHTAPHVIDTVGTHPVDLIYSFLVREFPNHVNLGIYNCRRIGDAGSSWSEHAFKNAYDAGGPQHLVRAMGDAVEERARRGELPASQVIRIREIWTPSVGWHPYTGTDPHTGHTHISGAPLLALAGRTPECAR